MNLPLYVHLIFSFTLIFTRQDALVFLISSGGAATKQWKHTHTHTRTNTCIRTSMYISTTTTTSGALGTRHRRINVTLMYNFREKNYLDDDASPNNRRWRRQPWNETTLKQCDKTRGLKRPTKYWTTNRLKCERATLGTRRSF